MTGSTARGTAGPLKAWLKHAGRPAQSAARGVVLCAVVAMAASHAAETLGGSPFLYALLLGALLHQRNGSEQDSKGVNFCASTLARLGVVLLGARLTVGDIAGLGTTSILIVGTAVATTVAVGCLLAERMGMDRWKGAISGGAAGVCGASAALAIAAALPAAKDKDQFTATVVAAVTLLSTVAMVLYPALARLLVLSPSETAVFLGGTIHDVAQVVAAGFLVSGAVAEHATAIKLLRVASLAVVVAALVALCAPRRLSGDGRSNARALRPPAIPVFVVGFLMLVALNSGGWLSHPLQAVLDRLSNTLLLTAVAALGVRTSMAQVASAGWRCALLVLAETAWIAGFVLGLLLLRRG